MIEALRISVDGCDSPRVPWPHAVSAAIASSCCSVHLCESLTESRQSLREHHLHGCVFTIRECTAPELAETINSPAVHLIIHADGACMPAASGDAAEPEPTDYRIILTDWRSLKMPEAQLTSVILPPA